MIKLFKINSPTEIDQSDGRNQLEHEINNTGKRLNLEEHDLKFQLQQFTEIFLPRIQLKCLNKI